MVVPPAHTVPPPAPPALYVFRSFLAFHSRLGHFFFVLPVFSPALVLLYYACLIVYTYSLFHRHHLFYFPTNPLLFFSRFLHVSIKSFLSYLYFHLPPFSFTTPVSSCTPAHCSTTTLCCTCHPILYFFFYVSFTSQSFPSRLTCVFTCPHSLLRLIDGHVA